MHKQRTVLAAMWLALWLPAQAGAQESTASAEYDKLVADWTATTTAYDVARKAMMETDAYQDAVKTKNNQAIGELLAKLSKPDAKAFGARALALADRFLGEPAVPFLTFAANNFGDGATVKSVVARLLKDHVQSPGMTDLLENAMSLARYVGAADTNALLTRVSTESPHAMPKAWAMYWRAFSLKRNRKASDADKALAEQWLAEAEKLAVGTPLAERIAAPRFETERLQVGLEVPDIKGEDVDGVPFQLSDYRGKVVVLDFWGFW